MDRDGDPQEHDSEVEEAFFEPSITRNSYYLLITDEGRKPPGRVEAVSLHGLPFVVPEHQGSSCHCLSNATQYPTQTSLRQAPLEIAD